MPTINQSERIGEDPIGPAGRMGEHHRAVVIGAAQHAIQGLQNALEDEGVALTGGQALVRLACDWFDLAAQIEAGHARIIDVDQVASSTDLLDSGSQPAASEAYRVSERRWTVTSKATSIRAACMGLGFAWYAEDIIRRELDSGQLKPLPLEKGRERFATLYLVFADADGAGPGTRRLARLLEKAIGSR